MTGLYGLDGFQVYDRGAVHHVPWRPPRVIVDDVPAGATVEEVEAKLRAQLEAEGITVGVLRLVESEADGTWTFEMRAGE